jgi:hypothetical protein
VHPEKKFSWVGFIVCLGVFYLPYYFLAKKKQCPICAGREFEKKKDVEVASSVEAVVIPHPQANPDTRNNKTYSFNVAGTSHKNDEGKDIQKMLKEYMKDLFDTSDAYGGNTNQDIRDEEGERFYEVAMYDKKGVTFVPEPDNKYNPSAIKIFIDELGHVGYIPDKKLRTMNRYLGKLKDKVKRYEWKIVGGKYKEFDLDEEKVVTRTDSYGIKITVTYEDDKE